TSTDHATTAEVLIEVIDTYRQRGREFDLVCCLYPTAPFVTPELLRAGEQRLREDPAMAGVIPVARFSYPIQRALRIVDGRLSLFQPEHLTTRSQDLEAAFHDAGQFYWVRTSAFLSSRSLMA